MELKGQIVEGSIECSEVKLFIAEYTKQLATNLLSAEGLKE